MGVRAIELIFLQTWSKMHRLQNDSNYPKVPEIRICTRLRDFCGRFASNLGRRILLHICSQSHIVKMCQKWWSMHAPCHNISNNTGHPRKHIGAAVRKGKWTEMAEVWVKHCELQISYSVPLTSSYNMIFRHLSRFLGSIHWNFRIGGVPRYVYILK